MLAAAKEKKGNGVPDAAYCSHSERACANPPTSQSRLYKTKSLHRSKQSWPKLLLVSKGQGCANTPPSQAAWAGSTSLWWQNHLMPAVDPRCGGRQPGVQGGAVVAPLGPPCLRRSPHWLTCGTCSMSRRNICWFLDTDVDLW